MTQRRDPAWLRTWWKWFTWSLLVIVVVGFGVPETIGVVHPGVGGTYTESIQDWLGIPGVGATAGWVTLTVLLAGVTTWFSVHLLGGWPWERKP